MRTFRFLLFLILSLIGGNSFGQLNVTNTRTGNHILLKGTQVFLEPPTGFETAANFLGFQNNSTGSSIMVIQMSGPYEEITQGFTADNMKTKGMSLLNKEALKINQYQGELFSIKQFSPAHGFDFQKYTLVLKLAPSSTLMINGNFPESQKDVMGEVIRKSVLSVFIEKSLAIDPFASVDFTIDISKSAFKPSSKTVSAGLLLEGPANELMVVAKSIRPINSSDKKGASINLLKAVSTFTYVELVDSKEIVQDGAAGYQIIAHILEKGVKKKAMQTILFGENYYYVFLAILSLDNKILVTDFEKIVASFRRK